MGVDHSRLWVPVHEPPVMEPPIKQPRSIKWLYSLRSKRFQSSYCAKVRAEAKKKKVEGGGGGEKRFNLSPPPPPSFLFLLSSQLSRRTRAETLATQANGYSNQSPEIIIEKYCKLNLAIKCLFNFILKIWCFKIISKLEARDDWLWTSDTAPVACLFQNTAFLHAPRIVLSPSVLKKM